MIRATRQADLALNLTTKPNRKRAVLAQMQRVVPRGLRVELVAPYAPECKKRRPPLAMQTLLRIHLMPQWVALSDPRMEEALHDTRLPKSTILRFRHHLQEHKLAAINSDYPLTMGKNAVIMSSSTSTGPRIMASHAALAAILLAATAHLAAAPADATNPASKARVRPAYPVGFPIYTYAGPCVSPGLCATWRWDDRRWRRPVAPDEPAPGDFDIWGTNGSPWGYVRRLPPPTPADHIQPRYREASTIRPEFDELQGEATIPTTPPLATPGALRQ